MNKKKKEKEKKRNRHVKILGYYYPFLWHGRIKIRTKINGLILGV